MFMSFISQLQIKLQTIIGRAQKLMLLRLQVTALLILMMRVKLAVALHCPEAASEAQTVDSLLDTPVMGQGIQFANSNMLPESKASSHSRAFGISCHWSKDR